MKPKHLFISGLLLLTGCTTPAADTSPPDTTQPVEDSTPSTSEPDPEPERPELEIPVSYASIEEEIVGRYLLYQEASDNAASAPEVDPDYEPLQELVAGVRAEEVKTYLENWKEAGYVQEARNSSSPEAIDPIPQLGFEGATAYVQDCLVDESIVRLPNAEVVDDDTVTSLLAVELTYLEGQWKVTRQQLVDEYEGVSECPK